MNDPSIAIAICFEIAVKAHENAAFRDGAEIYIASVAKTDEGAKNAHSTLSQIATRHSAIVMMANSVGIQDGSNCGGHSGVWDLEGRLMDSLGPRQQGLVVVDSKSLKSEVIVSSKEF